MKSPCRRSPGATAGPAARYDDVIKASERGGGMRKSLSAVLQMLVPVLLLLAGISAQAQTPAFMLDREAYTKKFVARPFQGDKLIEFVRPDDSFRDWNKLIRIRYQQAPRVYNDAGKFAESLVKSLQTKYPNLWHDLRIDALREEATLDYLLVDGNQTEYHVIRFHRSYDSRAVVSIQFIYRATDNEPPSREALGRLRESWLAQMSQVNMHQVHMTIER